MGKKKRKKKNQGISEVFYLFLLCNYGIIAREAYHRPVGLGTT